MKQEKDMTKKERDKRLKPGKRNREKDESSSSDDGFGGREGNAFMADDVGFDVELGSEAEWGLVLEGEGGNEPREEAVGRSEPRQTLHGQEDLPPQEPQEGALGARLPPVPRSGHPVSLQRIHLIKLQSLLQALLNKGDYLG